MKSSAKQLYRSVGSATLNMDTGSIAKASEACGRYNCELLLAFTPSGGQYVSELLELSAT
eukprot:2164886-Pleurochrysis_carterae.AAC.2